MLKKQYKVKHGYFYWFLKKDPSIKDN